MVIYLLSQKHSSRETIKETFVSFPLLALCFTIFAYCIDPFIELVPMRN